jgi:N-acetylglucosaminyldiphosphoundecaprenol N-acetyl-beta-D-mannosaminyltransferase
LRKVNQVEFRFAKTVIPVNMPNKAALLRAVQNKFRRREGFALATINLDHLVKLAKDHSFRPVYAAQDLVVADGNPIVWLSKLARRPVELVPGSDLVVPLAELAAAEGISVALFGSTDQALELAATSLRAAVPGLVIAAKISPPFGFDPHGAEARLLLAELAASGAGLCFLALGAPKQEILAAVGRQLTPQIGFASIGAGLDFLAGHQTRAPAWVRKQSLEWVWRMANSPRRLVPRYAKCAAALPLLTAQALRLRASTR